MTQTAQSLDETLRTHVARFNDRRADWDAFADARVEGFKRAQHRFIGSGASGKTDASVIPAQHFTLSVMFVPPGQGNASHTHRCECCPCAATLIANTEKLLPGGCSLRADVDSVERLARCHEQPIALWSTEANIAANFG